jgi:hypothetical protein
MLPVLIFVAVAVPLLVLAFIGVRSRKAEGETPAGGDDAQLEREFEDAARYEEQWREEKRKHPHDDSLY